ncbi:MAG: hypothetical protein ACREKE_10765, partial [bacterium]
MNSAFGILVGLLIGVPAAWLLAGVRASKASGGKLADNEKRAALAEGRATVLESGLAEARERTLTLA